MKREFKEVGELMEQNKEINKKIKEFNIEFSMLDEEAQESTLTLLRALYWANKRIFIQKTYNSGDWIEEGSY